MFSFLSPLLLLLILIINTVYLLIKLKKLHLNIIIKVLFSKGVVKIHHYLAIEFKEYCYNLAKIFNLDIQSFLELI
tara:strand:+ start:761 stop:988 length:228 start_codon:yes stop_codon:yes gene_type:complete